MHNPPEKPEHQAEAEHHPRSNKILNPAEILAKNVAHRRAQCALTQVECANRTRICVKKFRNIEAGKGNPDLKELIRIAVVLDTSIRDLFTVGAKR